MKFILLFAAAGLLWARPGAMEHRGHEAGSRGEEGRTVRKMRRVQVPAPEHIARPEHVVRERSEAPSPRHDDRGARITQPAATTPPAHHAVVVHNEAFTRQVQARQRVEVTPNRYYWHNEGGVRYAHYYRGGVHWYGFYHGPAFYWSRYYHNRWWWFDARFDGRWVYWWDGFWWWPGPAGVMYVYVDNDYYPYAAGSVTVVHEETQSGPPPTPGAGASFASPDGTRLVQITGDDGQAYLYDKTGQDPLYLKFLGRGAQKARFSGGTKDAPLQILLEFKDGSFALYDAQGQTVDAKQAAAPAAAVAPETTPDTAPPPPPGETQ